MELLAGVFIASWKAWESESLVAGSCNSDKLSYYIRTFQKTKTFLIFHSYHLEFKPAASATSFTPKIGPTVSLFYTRSKQLRVAIYILR